MFFGLRRFATSTGESEQRARRWSRSRLGRAGDEARELLPWTAGPGAQKNFDPEHPLAGDSNGLQPCAPSIFNTVCVVSSSLALSISHPLPIPRILPCLRARVDVYECRGGKRSVISPRGALNLPAARFLQTKRFGPRPFPLCTMYFAPTADPPRFSMPARSRGCV